MQAVSYSPIPEAREDCLRLAELSLQSIRRTRLLSRMTAIEEEIKTAEPGRKAELYRQIEEITQALEED